MKHHRQFIMCVEAARLKNTIWVNSVFAVLSIFNLVSTDWVDHKILLYLWFSDCRWSGCRKLLVDIFPAKAFFFFLRTVSNCNFQSWDRNRADFDLLHIWLIFYAWMFPIYEGEYCASTRQWVCLVGLQDLPRNRHVSLRWPHNGLVASLSFRYKTHNYETLHLVYLLGDKKIQHG